MYNLYYIILTIIILTCSSFSSKGPQKEVALEDIIVILIRNKMNRRSPLILALFMAQLYLVRPKLLHAVAPLNVLDASLISHQAGQTSQLDTILHRL